MNKYFLSKLNRNADTDKKNIFTVIEVSGTFSNNVLTTENGVEYEFEIKNGVLQSKNGGYILGASIDEEIPICESIDKNLSKFINNIVPTPII